MEKRLELLSPVSCLNKALPDEPIFVLRAKDPLAAAAVRHWAAMAYGVQDPEKVNEAYRAAETMERWYESNVPQTDPGTCSEKVYLAGQRSVQRAAPELRAEPYARP